MPDRASHLRQARRNAALAAHLAELPHSPYTDWVIIACFYAALHYVEAALYPEHTEKGGGQVHRRRQEKVELTWGTTVGRLYYQLQVASEIARYVGNGDPTRCYFDASLARHFVQLLARFKASIGYPE